MQRRVRICVSVCACVHEPVFLSAQLTAFYIVPFCLHPLFCLNTHSLAHTSAKEQYICKRVLYIRKRALYVSSAVEGHDRLVNAWV